MLVLLQQKKILWHIPANLGGENVLFSWGWKLILQPILPPLGSYSFPSVSIGPDFQFAVKSFHSPSWLQGRLCLGLQLRMGGRGTGGTREEVGDR